MRHLWCIYIYKRFLINRKGRDQVFLKLQISLQPSFMKRGRIENNVVAWNSSMTCNLGLPSWYIRHPWWKKRYPTKGVAVLESSGGSPLAVTNLGSIKSPLKTWEGLITRSAFHQGSVSFWTNDLLLLLVMTSEVNIIDRLCLNGSYELKYYFFVFLQPTHVRQTTK